MDQKEIAGLVSVVVLLLLVTIIIVLFIVFVRRKNKLLEEQEEAKKHFDRELGESQIEIREETLRNISWELHDNIGQIMTLAKIQSQLAMHKPELMAEVSETIGNGINELRALSKLINPEALKSLSLREAISLELERFNRMKFIEATLKVEGGHQSIESNTEIIIFRILQEFFSNTIKHSRATKLNVLLKYTDQALTISSKDNGVGFQNSNDFSGIGLKNMKTRAQLINAEFKITSEKNKGTALQLKYNLKIGL